MTKSTIFAVLAMFLATAVVASNAPDDYLNEPLLVPFRAETVIEQGRAIRARLEPIIYQELTSGILHKRVEIPLSLNEKVNLQVERFSVTAGETKYYLGRAGGNIEVSGPEVIAFRGTVEGDSNSHAFFAMSNIGTISGYFTRNGQTYYIAQSPAEAAKGWDGKIVIHNYPASMELPDGVTFCGVAPPENQIDINTKSAQSLNASGPRLLFIAAEADQSFNNMFGNIGLSQSYILTLIATVSDIYQRDINTKLIVKFLRVWDAGGEPFGADNLSSVANYWYMNEDPSPYNIVHLFSGRRDLTYGGVAYVGGTCSGGATYSITGFLNGSFPNPFGAPSNGNWDVIVVAHEMGHNCGTYHTHDGYFPTIDDCGNGTPSRGTIMSYCHIHAGYTANIDLHMHRIVEGVIENDLDFGGCFSRDCNGNNIPDQQDISNGTSQDINSNSILDECEDCNSNGILDPQDILNGAPDFNGNGIPDACEPDCNFTSRPDNYDILIGSSDDLDGNNVPDECDPDCNGNLLADFIEISNNMAEDFDRNNIPDDCQDCDGNLVSDWRDLNRQYNLFVADQGDVVREFHQASGYPITYYGNISDGSLDVKAGPDGRMYVANFIANNVTVIDPATGLVNIFVTAGLGGLSGPSALVFDAGADLLVASNGTNSVIKYNGTNGSLIGTLISAGSGGLSQPMGLVFAPNGNLLISSSGSNAILEFNGTTGAFVRVFTSGVPLSLPIGLAFRENGNLLVVSNGTYHVLEYDGLSGAFVGVFEDPQQNPSAPWGIRINSRGHVFVSENSHPSLVPRVLEYFPNGRFYRRYVRGDNSGLTAPCGFDFVPQSPLDRNRNGQLDQCDISLGISLDLNSNQIPDEAEGPDSDGDGAPDGMDNCPTVANANQYDTDSDGLGNVCDNCDYVVNVAQTDSDSDGLGDACDNCPLLSNPTQNDGDADMIGDACDNCPLTHNIEQTDTDSDGPGDACDNCPALSNAAQSDADADAVGDVCDNCPTNYNPTQTDGDGDGHADACDNCSSDYNPDQADSDLDGTGDVCEATCGDVNDNGSVNILDVTYLISYLYKGGPAPLPTLDNGDVNNSGTVNILDVTYMISYLYKGGPAPNCS